MRIYVFVQISVLVLAAAVSSANEENTLAELALQNIVPRDAIDGGTTNNLQDLKRIARSPESEESLKGETGMLTGRRFEEAPVSISMRFGAPKTRTAFRQGGHAAGSGAGKGAGHGSKDTGKAWRKRAKREVTSKRMAPAKA